MGHVEDFKEKVRAQLRDGLAAFGLEVPLDTGDAFELLGRWAGYDATRRHLDFCVHQRGMERPEKDASGRYAWGEEDLLRFALQLEEMRYWAPGAFRDKKTVFELEAEADLLAVTSARWEELLAMGACELIDLLVEADPREEPDIDAALNSKIPRDLSFEAPFWRRLSALTKTDDLQVRRALADLLKEDLIR